MSRLDAAHSLLYGALAGAAAESTVSDKTSCHLLITQWILLMLSCTSQGTLRKFLVVLCFVQVYPLEVIRRRMQQIAAAAVMRNGGSQLMRPAANQASLRAFSHAASEIWMKEGFGGFYAGVGPNTIQACSLRLSSSKLIL